MHIFKSFCPKHKILIFFLLYIFFQIIIPKINKFSQRRIFVTFMYNNEADMAYIHIWRLYDYVDRFIIIISKKYFFFTIRR